MFGRAVVVACLCALGCAADPPENPALIWCGAVCVAEKRCGDTRGFDQCRAEWQAGSPGLASLSAGGATALVPCLEGLTCSSLVDHRLTAAESNPCWEQAKLSVEVTPRDRSFCAEYARVWFECGSSYPVAECEVEYAMLASPLLDRLASCARETTCDAFVACDRSVKQAGP